jgi:arylsulfatase A-like enzyme
VAPDSYSFLPSLINSINQHPRTSIVTADAHGMHAIRMGDWKYIDDTPPVNLPENRLNQIKDFKPQLYNVTGDPGEKLNLYDERPEMVNKLRIELDRIRESDSTR